MGVRIPDSVKSALDYLAQMQVAERNDDAFLAVGMCFRAMGHSFAVFDLWAVQAGCDESDRKNRRTRWNSFNKKDKDYRAITGMAYRLGWREYRDSHKNLNRPPASRW